MREELRDDFYQPQPLRQAPIPKAGKPGEFRTLIIPTAYNACLPTRNTSLALAKTVASHLGRGVRRKDGPTVPLDLRRSPNKNMRDRGIGGCLHLWRIHSVFGRFHTGC